MKIGKQILMPAYVRPDQVAALAEVAKRLGVSRQSLLRDGLDLILKRHGVRPATAKRRK